MRLVIQRCGKMKLVANGELRCDLNGPGLLILAAWEENDDLKDEDTEWAVQKVLNMRIFPDSDGKMNLSVQDVGGYVTAVSNFTLFASTKKGNRPSFIRSASPDKAEKLYQHFISELKKKYAPVYDGIFGADMKVDFVNDGPVTIFIDTKNKE
jgi:D-tyrosyl-tRNA(Tyr) deacylase